MNYPDEIKRYLVPAAAGVRVHCPTCAMTRAVFVAETEGGETITCCATCQRVIKRIKQEPAL